MKFDGKAFAKQIEDEVAVKVSKMVNGPKIVSVLVGDHPSSTTSEWHGDPASVLYTRLKKEAAERVGIKFEIVKLEINNNQVSIIKQKVVEIGEREDVIGVMVQLPIPGLQGQTLQDVLQAIPLNKDIDGLRYPESGVVPPVVTAVIAILDKIALESRFMIQESSVVVMGANGSVGRALCLELGKHGIEVTKIDSDTTDPVASILTGDVVISCVGKEGVMTGEMIKDGVIAIDVGAPKGDMTRGVYAKASVSVEVPGGVGPVTIACLLQNAVSIVV